MSHSPPEQVGNVADRKLDELVERDWISDLIQNAAQFASTSIPKDGRSLLVRTELGNTNSI